MRWLRPKNNSGAVETADYIVVGGGTSGGVVAYRLALAGFQVLLLEAGGPAPSPTPFSRSLWDGNLVCRRSSTPQPGMGGRTVELLRGQVLGGSSTINSMLYVRGNPSDYDRWGSPVWGYKTVLDYFKRSENHQSRRDRFHGRDGPLRVGRLPTTSSLSRNFVEAGSALGFENDNWDFNGRRQQNGVGFYDFNVYPDGSRCGVYQAFLFDPPVGLRTITGVSVEHLLWEGDRVRGVRTTQGNSFRAERDVVLSCGALDSPAVLMRSGIGPEEILKKADVKLRFRCENLGKNLHDHVCCGVVFLSLIHI